MSLSLQSPNQPIQPTLMLLTHAPHHPLTQAGLVYAKQFCQLLEPRHLPDNATQLKIFLYSDAAYLANRLTWQPADMPNPTHAWQQLAKHYALNLQVCVSVALARGITDRDNAVRHGLVGDNLAQGFSLVGLGELAMALHAGYHVVQF